MALRRSLHMIYRQRLAFPQRRIMIVKTDLDAAYRCAHVAPRIAIKQLSIVDNIAYIGGRLPFGSSPAPSIFSIVSDVCFDLANDLLDDTTWDPSESRTPLHSALKPTVHLDEDLQVPVPLRLANIDGYIDDGIGSGFDIDDTIHRLQHSVPLVARVVYRSTGGEVLPRNDTGEPSKSKIVLGWLINTRLFIIQLPVHEFIAWSSDLKKVIKSKSTSFNDIKTIVGRLTHVAYFFTPGRFYLKSTANKHSLARK